nr:stage v sporulation protein k [Quercus suber]
MKILQRARNRPNFGNAGEVDIVLNKAKFLQQKRIAGEKGNDADTLKAEDFDPDFDRGSRAATNIAMMFKDVVGANQIVHKLEAYQRTAANMRARDMDPREQLPFNFLFRGPPGTGKTTTARKMGKVYYDMEFLASAEVVECSATELVGEYIGHTGPKTQKLLEKALGKVLFIDEAYRLADGPFAKEAMDEIVDCLTKEKFAQKLIVILAGYEQDINRLMTMNPGLTSRFPETISFNPLDTDDCIALLTRLMEKRKNDVDLSILRDSSEPFRQKLQERFSALSQIDNWANARDVSIIQKAVFGKLLATSNVSTARMVLSEELILQEIDAMIIERNNRTQNMNPGKEYLTMPQHFKNADATPSIISTDSKIGHETRVPDIEAKPSQMPVSQVTASEAQSDDDDNSRDPNVSDEVWQQLQRDAQAAKEREADYSRLVEQDNHLSASHAKAGEEELRVRVEFQAATDTLQQQTFTEGDEEARRHFVEERLKRIEAQREALDEAKRRAEELRIQSELARRAREEAETQRQQETVAQKKLRKVGVCVAGFRWTKQSAGYRCAGGSHFVSDAQLERMSA